MRRDEVLHILAAHRAELAAAGVHSLSLFGSVARDEAGPQSDIDILVEFDRPVGFFALGRLQENLEQWLRRRVDLAVEGSLRPGVRERVLREAVRAH
ncbi:MAG: nucleotidyltransferase family protein [Deltaproteobacteria bacterium]|nr:nucleotidyltransferase family protein [Deltaproteobacteria bacterium]